MAISERFLHENLIFNLLDTELVGVVHWVIASSQKVSPRKSCIFKQFTKVFPAKTLLYGIL